MWYHQRASWVQQRPLLAETLSESTLPGRATFLANHTAISAWLATPAACDTGSLPNCCAGGQHQQKGQCSIGGGCRRLPTWEVPTHVPSLSKLACVLRQDPSWQAPYALACYARREMYTKALGNS
jgi:hypothetical protein